MARLRHTDESLRVAAFLRKHGPLTRDQLVRMTGIPTTRMGQLLNAMQTCVGGAVCVGKAGRAFLYGTPGVHDVKPTAALREHVAGPRYVAPFVPLRRDFYAARDLAMRVRG